MSRDFAKRPTVNGQNLGLEAHEHDHVASLEADSRLYDEAPTAYPLGTSYMLSSDDITEGTFAQSWDAGVLLIETHRSDAGEGDAAVQAIWEHDYSYFPGYRRWNGTSWVEIGIPLSNSDMASYAAPLTHEHDHITLLSDDAYAESDPISDYPQGPSVMWVEATSNWDGKGAHATVSTHHAGPYGLQVAQIGSNVALRYYVDPDGWGEWIYPSDASHEHDYAPNLATDSRMYDDPPTAYPMGTSYMHSVNTDDSGYFAYEWVIGVVQTMRTYDADIDTVYAKQVLWEEASNFFYYRKWRAGSENSWSDWTAADSWSDLYGKPSTFPPSAHAASHTNSTDDIQSATASQKGLATSTQITKLDGIETGATADMTATEILNAIKTVDGSGSGLDTDTFDGHDTAYFAIASDLAAKADLVGGVVPTSQIPALAISDVFTVASQAAMLALTAQRGDIAVRTDFDPDRTYILSTDSPGTLADWIRVTFGDVVSVNGQTGVIVLGYSDVGAASTSDTRIPTQDENDALVGTNGTPSTTNKYVTNSDARNTDTRTPTDGSVTNAKVDGAAAIAESKLNLASDAVAGTASRRTLGTGAQQAASGNDARFSDARTPTAHQASHVTGSDVIPAAVAGGNNGLFRGTDQAKLDAIESGATADQTSTEIRAAIKYADDALDGAAALSGYDTGFSYLYVTSSSTGWPVAATPFHIVTMKQSGSSAKQRATSTASAREWQRHWSGSAWSAWVETTDVSNLQGYSSLATDAEVSTAVSNHEAASNPHPTYLTQAEGDALYQSAGSSLSLTEVERDLASYPKKSGKFTITGSGLTTGQPVMVSQASGPYTGKGSLADEAEMDHISVVGRVTSATNIDCYWNSQTYVKGNFKFAYAVG